jgi:hypothetical protein
MCILIRELTLWWGAGAYDRVAVRLLGSSTPTNFPLWMGEQEKGEEEEKGQGQGQGQEQEQGEEGEEEEEEEESNK